MKTFVRLVNALQIYVSVFPNDKAKQRIEHTSSLIRSFLSHSFSSWVLGMRIGALGSTVVRGSDSDGERASSSTLPFRFRFPLECFREGPAVD